MLVLLFTFIIPAILKNAREAAKIMGGKKERRRTSTIFN
jgi:hypothetical protein